jgi:spore coat polysaccharide biosynthesis predicted glycosyltransferase SpsG
MKSALFLVDDGPGVGLGHLRRSGILLDAMTRAGFACRMLCPDVTVAAALGRAAAPMPASPKDVPPADAVICDSYAIGGDRLRYIRDHCRVLLVFDDMGDHRIEADLVLNHNLYGATVDYSRLTKAVVLSGPECTLVDAKILDARARRKSGSGNGIVISFGGTDDGTRAVQLARHLPPDAGGPCHIVVPPGIAPSEAAAALAAERPAQVVLHRGADMPALLAEARLYLGGAGMTALEAMVIGLDMILFVVADNQRLNAEAFARFGHAVVQGFEPRRGAEMAAALLRRPFRQHASPVDGKGAARVVAAIERLLQAKIVP